MSGRWGDQCVKTRSGSHEWRPAGVITKRGRLYGIQACKCGATKEVVLRSASVQR